MSAKLKIFSYLPNPRVWKAQIAAELCGVELEVVGDEPPKLAEWLWDFDARPLPEEDRTGNSPHARRSRRGFGGVLFKTDAFLQAHPFGTVPAAFDPSGEVGIFESNSILRAVARCGEDQRNLYGAGPYERSRTDSFLDAGLVFTREAQAYIFALPELSLETYERMAAAYEFYLSGIESALSKHAYLTGTTLTIADIAFACDLTQFLGERKRVEELAAIGKAPITTEISTTYPRACTHLLNLSEVDVFEPYLARRTHFLRSAS